jgi:hypothetical protein
MQALFKKAKYAGILASVIYFMLVAINLMMATAGTPDYVVIALDIIP